MEQSPNQPIICKWNIRPSPKSCWFYTHDLKPSFLLHGLLWRAPHLSFSFYSCCFQSIVSITANMIFFKHPSGHVISLFTGHLLVLPGRPKSLMVSEGHSLISWQSPLGLCDPSTPAFYSTNTFTSFSPIADSWHLLYHLFGMFFLHSLFFCLVHSYSCFRCQCKCYVLGEAFKPTYSLFFLIIWFASLQNIYVSL